MWLVQGRARGWYRIEDGILGVGGHYVLGFQSGLRAGLQPIAHEAVVIELGRRGGCPIDSDFHVRQDAIATWQQDVDVLSAFAPAVNVMEAVPLVRPDTVDAPTHGATTARAGAGVVRHAHHSALAKAREQV